MRTLPFIALALLLGWSLATPAAQRWADRLNAGEGEALLWLNAVEKKKAAPMEEAREAVRSDEPGERFAALVLPFLTPKPNGGVILLHDTGAHPDWPGVIGPLRRGLPEHGWATLSIEVPPAGEEETLRRTVDRIRGAVRFYNQRQLFNIVLIGHGVGAVAASTYLGEQSASGISAFVAISLPTPPIEAGGLPLLETLQVPTLELFGSGDLPEVIDTAHEREMAVKRGGNRHYRQQRIDGADHFFHALDTDLLRLVRGWLQRYASGMEIELGGREGLNIRRSLGIVELPSTGGTESGGGGVSGAAAPAGGDIELDDAP